mmetsp:Transcript_46736/g.146499  ORF Transcript_46736/g.146499 Transcript_46736/m.146499 type:complete len:617 (-) Transcript_46736:32-1882(-)
MLLGISIGEDILADDFLQASQLLPLCIQDLLLLGACPDLAQDLRRQPAHAVLFLLVLVLEGLLELLVVVGHDVQRLILDEQTVHPILPVEELDDVIHGISRRAVVVHLQRLHGLHQSPLDVPRLRGLARRVNDTLATAHRVHPHLLRRQPPQVGILHEPAGLGAVVVLGEVGERAVVEAIPYPRALHVLLAHARDDLGDVDGGALAPGVHHGDDVVPLVERAGADVAGILSGGVETLVHLGLKGLVHRLPRLRLQLPALGVSQNGAHLHLGLLQRPLDTEQRLVVGDDIRHAAGEAVVGQPLVHQLLQIRQEIPATLRPIVKPQKVQKRATARTDGLLADNAREKLTVLDDDLAVTGREVRFILLVLRCDGRVALHRDALGQQHRQQLLAGPQLLGLQNAGDRQLTVPDRQPHEQVHGDVLLQERVALGVLGRGQQTVLHDTHDGLVALWRDELPRVQHNVLDLRARLVRLRQVQVHLVAVEVRVVGVAVHVVQPDGLLLPHDLRDVGHDAGLVQRRLPVHQQRVAVPELAKHSHRRLPRLDVSDQLLGDRKPLLLWQDGQLPYGLAAVGLGYVHLRGARILRAALDQPPQPVGVVVCRDLRVRQLLGDHLRDANL